MSSTTVMSRNQQDAVTAQAIGTEVTALDVSPLGSMLIPAYKSFAVTSFNGANNPLVIKYYSDSASTLLIATMTLTYAVSGSVETASVTYS